MFCSGLIDQGRYIGSDPVGYHCLNLATNKFEGDDIFLCDRCLKMLAEEPHRITLFYRLTPFYSSMNPAPKRENEGSE